MSKYFYAEATFIDQGIMDLVSSYAFEAFGCSGIEMLNMDEPSVDKLIGKRAYSVAEVTDDIFEDVNKAAKESLQTIKFYFETQEKSHQFFQSMKELKGVQITPKSGEGQDWNESWREHYRTIEVQDFLNVVPSWEKENHNNNKDVFLYPGMGFGTGQHETTFLCLKSLAFLMNKTDFSSIKRVLDFGCGSGILGIAAAKKINNTSVDFVDVDTKALENTIVNLEHNDLQEDLRFKVKTRDNFVVTSPYNIVFANILSHILIEEKITIISSVNSGGYLILSGILINQKEEVVCSYLEDGKLRYIHCLDKGDWTSLVFAKL